MNCTEPEFWEQRYRANRMPWDLHGVPPALVRYLQRCNKSGTTLLPGCGSGYELKTFHEFGWDALAIDFSPAAVARAREVLGPLGSHVRLADFFEDDFGGPFDLVYERTFLCSLPPDRWGDYVARMGELVTPGGQLAGISSTVKNRNRRRFRLPRPEPTLSSIRSSIWWRIRPSPPKSRCLCLRERNAGRFGDESWTCLGNSKGGLPALSARRNASRYLPCASAQGYTILAAASAASRYGQSAVSDDCDNGVPSIYPA